MSPDPIFGFDAAGRLTFWNGAMEKLCGQAAGDVVGRPLREVFPGLAGTEEERQQGRALSGLPARSTSRFLPPNAASSGRLYEVEYSPLPGNDGRIAGGFAILRDITES